MKEIINKAKQRGACQRIADVNNYTSAINLFFSPQGREFCISNNFPTLTDWQRLSKAKLREHNILVDADNITINSNGMVGIVGNTKAKIYATDPSKIHYIVAMHGCSIDVIASDYTIVVIECSSNVRISVDKQQHSIIHTYKKQ